MINIKENTSTSANDKFETAVHPEREDHGQCSAASLTVCDASFWGWNGHAIEDGVNGRLFTVHLCTSPSSSENLKYAFVIYIIDYSFYNIDYSFCLHLSRRGYLIAWTISVDGRHTNANGQR